jgi:hypothetical protein
MVFEGKARRVLMRFVPRNFGMTSSIEALPNVLLSKSKNRQSILKYFFFDLVVFSSAESYVTHRGFLVPKQVVYTGVFGLKSIGSRSYVISPCFKSGRRRWVVGI